VRRRRRSGHRDDPIHDAGVFPDAGLHHGAVGASDDDIDDDDDVDREHHGRYHDDDDDGGDDHHGPGRVS
jgi:hypothetical protein